MEFRVFSVQLQNLWPTSSAQGSYSQACTNCSLYQISQGSARMLRIHLRDSRSLEPSTAELQLITPGVSLLKVSTSVQNLALQDKPMKSQTTNTRGWQSINRQWADFYITHYRQLSSKHSQCNSHTNMLMYISKPVSVWSKGTVTILSTCGLQSNEDPTIYRLGSQNEQTAYSHNPQLVTHIQTYRGER